MLKKIFFIGIYWAIASALCAQQSNSDSALTNTQSEVPFSEIRKSHTNNKKGILKFNVVGTMLNGFDISYERKIAPKWSLNLSSVTSFQLQSKNTHVIAGLGWISRPSVWNQVDFAQNFSLQVRYYYNLEKRKRLGKSTHFSGNYFAFETGAGYNRYNNSVASYFSNASGHNFMYSAGILFGIQRKIGKRVYFDFNVGIGIKHYQVEQNKGNMILPSIKVGVGITF